MPSPEASLVVIECPHCGTRYQIDYAAIGTKGRPVSCAHCLKSWEAHADPPRPAVMAMPRPAGRQKDFDELAEEALDEKFVIEERRHKQRHEAAAKAEEDRRAAKAAARADALSAAATRASAKAGAPAGTGAVIAEFPAAAPTLAADEDEALREADHQRTLDEIRAAIAPKPAPTAETSDPAEERQRQQAFWQRQKSLHSQLPQARLRRLARIMVLVAVVAVIGGGLMFRSAIVEQFPQLAGPYAALGLGVNVVGLEFQDVRTVQSLQEGAEVLVVNGTIRSVASVEVALPQVIVTLLDAKGHGLYEWSMTPKAAELEPGESLAFETQLTAPPQGATGVKLTFANARTQSKPPDAVIEGTAPAAATPEATAGQTSDKDGMK